MAITITTIETIGDLKEYVKAITAKYRSEREEAPKPEGPKSEIAKKLLAIWDESNFGCQRPHVAEILRAIVKEVAGEDVEFKSKKEEDDHSFEKFCAIVPLNNVNRHVYEIGKASIVKMVDSDGDAILLKDDGENGNYFRGDWRYATDEEIETLFDAFGRKSKSIIKHFE